MRVLYVASYWPTADKPWSAPFLVREVEFLRQAGIAVDVFPYHGHRRISNYARIYHQLQTQIQTGSYDLVHAQFGHSGLLAGMPKRLPLVVTFHGSELQGIYGQNGRYEPISGLLRLAMQAAAYLADEVILVAERLSRFLWRKDFHVIPGGVDLNTFIRMPQQIARQQLGLPLEGRLVLFIGSPQNPVKRYPLAQAAMEALPPLLKAELLVVNRVAPDQIPVYLSAGDVLLLTSKHEGSPTVVKEALACDLPVVSTDVGDVQERIGRVAGCAVCKDDRPEAIAAALATVLMSETPFEGRSAVSDLGAEPTARRIINVYQKALAGE